MKLLSVYSQGVKVCAKRDETVWDLRAAYALYLAEVERDPAAMDRASHRVPADMIRFAELNHGSLEVFETALAYLEDSGRLDWLRTQGVVLAPDSFKILPPVLRPSKILCVGNSFTDHIENVAKVMGREQAYAQLPPEVKISFLKAPSAIVGDGEPLIYPGGVGKWDYEAELAIVIGRNCANVEAVNARDYVLGYTVMNDGSVRDVPEVMGGLTSPLGKSRDTMAPLGPVIVTPQEPDFDPDKLEIRSWVNGDLRQDGTSADLLWSVDEIVSAASKVMRLQPGDVISTGSPAGVALETGKYLHEGDVVRVEVARIGYLENRVTSNGYAETIEKGV